ncbi:MAG: PAS domain-containing protein [Proteobacteria bacterium]|jgi:PAS domain S-box-containing protein|nr:PAS domain-containing protein [Pseudomonadota bacterium]
MAKDDEIARLEARIAQLEAANADLGAREAMYRAVVESAQDMVFAVGADRRVLYVNRFAASTLSSSPEALIGRPVAELFPDDTSARQVANLIRVFESGEPLHLQAETEFPDAPRWLDTWLVPARDDSGAVTSVFGVSRDITTRLEYERRLRTTIANAPIALWTVDREQRFTFADGVTVYALGLTPEQIVGRKVAEVFPALTGWSELRPRLAAGETITLISEIHGKVIESRLSAIMGPECKFRGTIGVSTDVTDRVETERALAEERGRLAATLSAVGDGVITTDLRGCVTTMNGIAERLTGWTQGEALGRPVGEVFRLVSHRTRAPLDNPVRAMLKLGERAARHVQDRRLVSRAGEEALVADTCAPIYGDAGEVTGALVVFQDVTRQRLLEEELARIEKLESVGVLAGGIAHDFNNILTAAMGSVTLAGRQEAGDPRVAKNLEAACRALERARGLTSQLLTFSKGGMPVKTLTSARALIEESTGFALHGSAAGRAFSIAEDLWPVEVDEGQISQVLQNLVLNASQAMPEGGVVRISAENVRVAADEGLPLEPGRYVRIGVADSGCGIPEENLDRVFDPYFTTKPGGSGLGLATTYSILRRHGGHVSVESTVGVGSTFRVYLPATARSREERVLDAPADSEARSGRVLLMDDDAVIREVATRMLESLDYTVEAVEEGAAAVETYCAALDGGRRFDAVIMDLTIVGGMGGRDAVRLLKERDRTAVVLASSGYSNDPVMSDHAAHGFDGVLPKPYTVAQLAAALRRLI